MGGFVWRTGGGINRLEETLKHRGSPYRNQHNYPTNSQTFPKINNSDRSGSVPISSRQTSPGFSTTSSSSVTTTESRVSEVLEVVELYTQPQYRLPEPRGTGDTNLRKRS